MLTVRKINHILVNYFSQKEKQHYIVIASEQAWKYGQNFKTTFSQFNTPGVHFKLGLIDPAFYLTSSGYLSTILWILVLMALIAVLTLITVFPSKQHAKKVVSDGLRLVYLSLVHIFEISTSRRIPLKVQAISAKIIILIKIYSLHSTFWNTI